MPFDFDPVLVCDRCARCGREVATSHAELCVTGIFVCRCGARTRRTPAAPLDRTRFSHAGWDADGDAYLCGR